jgi:hypothetical protein
MAITSFSNKIITTINYLYTQLEIQATTDIFDYFFGIKNNKT